MKTDMENTYNENNIDQIGLDWDEYEEMMAEYNHEQLINDELKYEDDYVQRAIRNWQPEDTDVNDVDYWLD